MRAYRSRSRGRPAGIGRLASSNQCQRTQAVSATPAYPGRFRTADWDRSRGAPNDLPKRLAPAPSHRLHAASTSPERPVVDTIRAHPAYASQDTLAKAGSGRWMIASGMDKMTGRIDRQRSTLYADPHRSAIDFAAQAVQDLARQDGLDLLEEFVLFAPDVSGQQCAELLQQPGRWRGAQFGDESLHGAMFAQQVGDDRHRPALGKEHLLLDLEMIGQFQLVAVDGAPRLLGHVLQRGILRQCPSGQYAERQPIMVLLGQRNQAGIA